MLNSMEHLHHTTFRGTSSSHTSVLWNGIPINSIANGLADLSSIFCHSFSDVVIVNGGDGSLFGSGAIGGSIHLNSTIKEDKANKLLLSTSKEEVMVYQVNPLNFI